MGNRVMGQDGWRRSTGLVKEGGVQLLRLVQIARFWTFQLATKRREEMMRIVEATEGKRMGWKEWSGG